jgi:hypothetical protein
MATEMRIVYTDVETGRVGRVADYSNLICPADLDDFAWQVHSSKTFPQGFLDDIHNWSISVNRAFKKETAELSQEHKQRIKLLSDRAECLENFSRVISGMRFIRAVNMFGRVSLQPVYKEEIAKYKATGEVGPLIDSLVDSPDELPIAVAEFEVKNASYEKFLLASEVQWNKWSRKIKNSSDPFAIIETIKQATGMGG